MSPWGKQLLEQMEIDDDGYLWQLSWGRLSDAERAHWYAVLRMSALPEWGGSLTPTQCAYFDRLRHMSKGSQ